MEENKGVCQLHFVALPFYIYKSILRQKKKNYGKLKYFTMQILIFQKKKIPLKKTQNPSRILL